MDNTEFYILVYTSKSESFLLKVGEYLYTEDVKEITKKSYFDNRHAQTLLNLQYYIYTKTSKLASLKDIEFLVGNIYSDEQQKKDIMDVVNDIYKFDEEINWQLVEGEALIFIKNKKFIEALNNSEKDLMEKNYDAVIDKLQKSTQVTFDSDYGVDIKNWDAVKEILTEVTDSSEAIPTGYDILDSDKVLGGGLRKKSLNLIGANSGIGKTMMLCNLALNMALAGKKVLYISLETSTARLVARILANILNTTTTNISYTMNDEEGQLKQTYLEAIKMVQGDLRIKEFQTGSMSCNKIETYMLDLKKNLKETYDCLIIDYLSICTPNDKKISKENSYAYDGAIAVDMRALAYSQNCAVLSGIQMNRDSIKGESGATKTIISTDGIANSLAIEFTADLILTLSKDQVHQKKNQLMCYVAKNRNAEKGAVFTMQITDSCRLVEIKEKNSM